MDGKARFIFPVVMTAMMVFVVTLLVTIINLGFPPDFLWQWAKAFVLAWPVAAVSAYFAIPVARRLTGWIVAAIDRAPCFSRKKRNIWPNYNLRLNKTPAVQSCDIKDFAAARVSLKANFYLEISIP